MKLKILSKKNNSLFNRTEVTASATEFKSTPSRKELLEAMSTELKCDAGALVLEQIHQPFGSKSVTITAKVYDSPDAAAKAEPKFKFERGQAKAQPKPS